MKKLYNNTSEHRRGMCYRFTQARANISCFASTITGMETFLMKRFYIGGFTICFLVCLPGLPELQAQWNTSGNDIHSTNSGNVGIGTTTPGHKLDVAGDINSTQSYLIGGDTVLAVSGSSIYLGKGAGYSNNAGILNTFIGTIAGGANTDGSWNTFIGFAAGSSNTTGHNNTFIGLVAGQFNTTGSKNTFSGQQAGHSNTIGSWNTFSGYEAGASNREGNYNTFSGYRSGFHNNAGENNTFTGSFAGHSNMTGSGNVFLGYRAGYHETSSNRLYIANDSTTTPLIYGEFDNGLLRVSGQLDVAGDVNSTQSYLIGGDTVLAVPGVNTFVGRGTSNGGGSYNTFSGFRAGYSNTTGSYNTFSSSGAGFSNTTGNYNTFSSSFAGHFNTTGHNLLLDNGQFLTVTRSDDGFAQQLFGMDGNNDVLLNRSAIVHGKVSRTIIGFNGRSFDVRNGSNQVLIRAVPSGNVGIGTASPSARLEVAGQVKITGGNPGAGKVLVSDGDGLASWESLSALSTNVTNERRLEQLEAENKAISDENKVIKTELESVKATNKAIKERLAALEARLGTANPAPTTAVGPSATAQDEGLKHKVRGAVLYQNTPNPFDENTVVRYVLPEGTQRASILIYNMNGEELMTYDHLQGNSELEINGGILKAGMYLYSLIADGKEVDTKRMILTR